jgi:hypothetical protein
MAGPVLHSLSETYPDLTRYSPAPVGLVSQARAEAALTARARELGARLRFRTRCEAVSQDPAGATVTLRSLDCDLVREGARPVRGGRRRPPGRAARTGRHRLARARAASSNG